MPSIASSPRRTKTILTMRKKLSTKQQSAKSSKGVLHTLNYTTPSPSFAQISQRATQNSFFFFSVLVTPSQITTSDFFKSPQVRLFKV